MLYSWNETELNRALFVVCTSQFVAMFTGSCESGGAKRSCNGYITQSTRRLRAMLKNLVRYVASVLFSLLPYLVYVNCLCFAFLES